MCINTLYVCILYTWFHLFPRAGSTCDRSTLLTTVRARSLLAAACACAGPRPSRQPASGIGRAAAAAGGGAPPPSRTSVGRLRAARCSLRSAPFVRQHGCRALHYELHHSSLSGCPWEPSR
jgi:hypothetical protein